MEDSLRARYKEGLARLLERFAALPPLLQDKEEGLAIADEHRELWRECRMAEIGLED